MPPILAPFSARLVAWQALHGRNHLPWVGQSAYEVWLSEVMLQQTQVATVLPYFAKFMRHYPTVAALASAPVDEVLAHWAGLGYYARARNLHRCAQVVTNDFGGVFPTDLVQLQTLPGIGPSTAAAIVSLAYAHRAAIMDGNVKRVIARHAGIEGWAGTPAVLKQLNVAALQRLNTAPSPNPAHRRHSQGLMDLGAMLCTPKAPQCDACPVASDCNAWQTQRTASIPAPRPKKALPQQQRHALVLHTPQGVWLERRTAQGLWGGLLSLPEADSYVQLCAFAQTLGLKPSLQPWHTHTLKHTFTHYQLHWTVWGAGVGAAFAPPSPWQFATWEGLATAGVPRAVSKVLT